MKRTQLSQIMFVDCMGLMVETEENLQNNIEMLNEEMMEINMNIIKENMNYDHVNHKQNAQSGHYRNTNWTKQRYSYVGLIIE